jgi:phosphatidylserine/phosphatidylglycerophosphate/cardiolipin synthase-like enzyme
MFLGLLWRSRAQVRGHGCVSDQLRRLDYSTFSPQSSKQKGRENDEEKTTKPMQQDVITGSFDFTRAAQEQNAENVLLINDDPVLAAAYTTNWEQRADASRPLRDFRRLQQR